MSQDNHQDHGLELRNCFSRTSINPQGQLCFHLNPPVVFAKCLSQVAETGTKYGHFTARSSPQLSQLSGNNVDNDDDGDNILAAIFFVDSVSVLRRVAATCKRAGDDGGRGSGGGDARPPMSISEGRGVVLMGVVTNLLRARGHAVHHHPDNWPQVSW